MYKKDLFADVSFTHSRIFDDEVSTYRLFLRSKKTVFINLLKDYKQTLEYHHLTDTEEYKDICFRLKLFFEAEQN